MVFYLDTNVVVSAIITDDNSTAALSWFENAKGGLVVGTFSTIEVAAVLTRLVRTHALTEAEGHYAQETFDKWLSLDADLSATLTADLEAAQRHARDSATKLSAPDAIHLAQATRLNAVLVTFDNRLADAARRYGMPVIIPD